MKLFIKDIMSAYLAGLGQGNGITPALVVCISCLSGVRILQMTILWPSAYGAGLSSEFPSTFIREMLLRCQAASTAGNLGCIRHRSSGVLASLYSTTGRKLSFLISIVQIQLYIKTHYIQQPSTDATTYSIILESSNLQHLASYQRYHPCRKGMSGNRTAQ